MKTKTLVSVSLLLLFRGVCPVEAKAGLYINEILVANVSSIIDPYFKEFSGWIELYNSGKKLVDLGGFSLTNNPASTRGWKIPPDTFIQPNGFLLFWTDGKGVYNHTSFKMKVSGGVIRLLNPGGKTIDQVVYGRQTTGISLGRKPDGSAGWFYLGTPTPNVSNTAPGYETQRTAEAPEFSQPGGFYQGSQSVKLAVRSTFAVIRYTVDGSIPTERSNMYTAPVYLDSTTVLRARVFNAHHPPSPTVTHSYFINERFTLPVVSLATDPVNLWDNKIGIYVNGENASPEMPYWGANFLEKWERPASVEFFDAGGKLGFSFDAGIKPAGTTSLASPMKSLVVRARARYGTSDINYRIFEDSLAVRFRSFVLRNSGDDWASTVFRDAMIRKLLEGQMDLDFQLYRPVIVFLNGKYWGIHYLTEKIDKYYLASNHGVDPNNLDLVAYFPDPYKRVTQRVIAGSKINYNLLQNFIRFHNMAVPENYQYVKSRIDINEYLNYQIAEIYIANADWPGGNMKYWRPGTKNGKWRWILFDTDLGFGLYFDYKSDMVKFAMEPNGPEWPNPPAATLVFRKLMENSEFRNDFIQRFAGYLNTTFQPERVIKVIDAAQAEIEPEMPRYIERWKNRLSAFGNLRFPPTMAKWKTNIDGMRTFARQRPSYIRQHIINDFHLSGTATLTLQVNEPGGGYVLINAVPVPSRNFSGIYFKDVPVQLRAVSKPGYRFLGWQGAAGGKSVSTSIVLKEDATVSALFTRVNWLWRLLFRS